MHDDPRSISFPLGSWTTTTCNMYLSGGEETDFSNGREDVTHWIDSWIDAPFMFHLG